MACWK